MHNISNLFYSGTTLYMFRTIFPSIIRSLRLYIQHQTFLWLLASKQPQNLYDIRGMFKKRPNFLNSTPTSTDSTLRLLSTHSVRFWQQTPICSVSLWALVVELHLLNWARALAVRRISDKVTMKELEEQCLRARERVCEILLQTW